MLEQDRLRLGLVSVAERASGQLPAGPRALAKRRQDAHSYSALIGLPVTQVAQVQILDPTDANFGKFIPIPGFNSL